MSNQLIKSIDKILKERNIISKKMTILFKKEKKKTITIQEEKELDNLDSLYEMKNKEIFDLIIADNSKKNFKIGTFTSLIIGDDLITIHLPSKSIEIEVIHNGEYKYIEWKRSDAESILDVISCSNNYLDRRDIGVFIP